MWGNVKGSLVKGDSPRCGEMSRSDKGDGLPSGAGRESTSGLRDYSGSLVKGDSPQCGEMSRSDKGDGLPSGAGCEQREQTEGLFRLPFQGRQKRIKRSRTFFLKSVNSYEIPPACLRQPTSLFKGGKKRIKRSRTFFLNSVNSYEIPPACLRQPTSLFKGGKSGLKVTHILFKFRKFL